MQKGLIEKKLAQAVALIEECRAALSTEFSSTKKKMKIVRAQPQTLADHVLRLRGKNFFKEPRTAQEAHLALQDVYHCQKKRVVVELIRLHKKRELRKTTKEINGKALTAYVW